MKTLDELKAAYQEEVELMEYVNPVAEAYIEALENRIAQLERGYAAMYAMPFTPPYLHSQEAMRAFLREAYSDILEMVERHNK